MTVFCKIENIYLKACFRSGTGMILLLQTVFEVWCESNIKL